MDQKVTITLDWQERQAMLHLLDAALRHAGAGALDVAAHFKAKLAKAQSEVADAPHGRASLPE